MERLERRVQRLERLCLGLVLALVVVVCGAAYRGPGDAKFGTVTAECLNIVDDVGNIRGGFGTLGKNPNATVFLRMDTADAKGQFSVNILDNQTVAGQFQSSAGPSVTMGTNEKGQPFFWILDAKGKTLFEKP